MFQGFKQLTGLSNLVNFQYCSKSWKVARMICFVLALLIPFSSISAHKRPSLQPFTQLYESGNCKELIHQLNNLSKPKSWNNNILWSGSRILKAKCHREIGNFKLALKRLKQTPESELREARILQKIHI